MAENMPLTGIVVVDCSEGVATAYAGRLLADLGATVVKVESPIGDRLRRLGPFPGDVEDAERGGLHLALNAGKKSAVADFADVAGHEEIRKLALEADIFIAPRLAGESILSYESLSAVRPDLVYVDHSPFGLEGPYADRVTSEIVDYAMGGYMYFSGDPSRHPLLQNGHQAEMHAGMHLATGAAVGAWHAKRTGAGQRVEVTTWEAMLQAHAWLISSWTHQGIVLSRLPSVMVPCADGHIFWMPVAKEALFALIERPDLFDDPRIGVLGSWQTMVPEVRGYIAEWAADKTKQEIYHSAQSLQIPITPVNTTEDLANSEQLAFRNWWRPVTNPVAGETKIPGPPWLFSTSETGPQSGAPLLGADTGLELPKHEAATPPNPAGANKLPFEGIRVLEVTANWAGPLAGRHLADLGADVIKIETGRRPATRALAWAGSQMWNRPYNRAGYFNLFNRNKRDLVLDLSKPRGRELFLQMVDEADIVLENNSARVFESFRLTYETLSARNPRIIMCSISGFGATGPERDYVAYGSNIEASSGLVAGLGYGDGLPYGTGSYYADPIAGTHGALGLVAALIERERTGRGTCIDMALQESGMAFGLESLMDYQVNGRVAGPANNRSRRIAPQGAYRSVGDDCWLAIGVETDPQWRALCNVMDRDDLAEAFPDVRDRQANREIIDEAISAWSAKYDHQEATQILQKAGVPAGPVLANWEILPDPHLYERDYFIDVVHPEVGRHQWDGYPWKFSRTPPPKRAMHAPLFGEHNDDILTNVLGLSEDEIAELRATALVADAPTT